MSSKTRIRWIQHCVNMFNAGKPVGTKNRMPSLHYKPLRLDGVAGHQTKVAIQKTRYHCGIGPSNYRDNPTSVSDDFLRIIKDPFSGSRSRRRLASKRRRARIARWKKQRVGAPTSHGGLTMLDGRQVVTWIARGLVYARRHGVSFSVISGYRTPAYSRSLCYPICGGPRCPGLCAGDTSNHSGLVFPRGAADTAGNAGGARAKARQGGVPLNNHLPRDYPHSSYSGY